MGLRPSIDYHVIDPGVDQSRVHLDIAVRHERRKELGLGDSDLLGVTTARLVPIKNHMLLLKAIALSKSRGVTWNWVLLGDGPLRAACGTTRERWVSQDMFIF
jgi:glycosyltransferase involved in cell wall biosynthesis